MREIISSPKGRGREAARIWEGEKKRRQLISLYLEEKRESQLSVSERKNEEECGSTQRKKEKKGISLASKRKGSQRLSSRRTDTTFFPVKRKKIREKRGRKYYFAGKKLKP